MCYLCQGSMLFFLVCHLFPRSYVTFPHLSPLLAFFPHLSPFIVFSTLVTRFPSLSHHVRFFTWLSFLYIPLPMLTPPLYVSRYITLLGHSLIRALCQKGPPQSFLSGSFLA